MRLLLDTHVVMWAALEPERLGPETTALLGDMDHERLISAISFAEIAIKRRLGKLAYSVTAADTLRALDAQPLAFEIAAAEALALLPLAHADPFDRMLAAQATVGGLHLVTADRVLLSGYPNVGTIDARR